MKRIAFLLGIMVVGIIALLESSGKKKRSVNYMLSKEPDDELWLGN